MPAIETLAPATLAATAGGVGRSARWFAERRHACETADLFDKLARDNPDDTSIGALAKYQRSYCPKPWWRRLF